MPMSRTAIAAAVVLLAGCSRAQNNPSPAAAPPKETAAGQPLNLPPPFATRSANNGPRVQRQPEGAALKVPDGYRVTLWATGLDNPRNLVLSPNGDVFVVESGPSRVRVFRPEKGDYSRAGEARLFVDGLRQPFGLAFHGGYAYVANTGAVVRFAYKPGQEKAAAPPEQVTELTPGGYNQHWTRNVIADPKRNKLYVSVGSRTNVDAEEPPRASILEMNPDGSGRREYAGGLRNPVGLAINPANGRLWTAVNERDGLGDDLPPDYATEVKDGGFYGWPYAYIGPNEDPRRKGERPDLVAKTLVPDVLVGPHAAALGLTFNPGKMFPGKGDLFVALHGSWNRSEPYGYKVIRVPMKNGRPAGKPQDFLTGFVIGNNQVWGRPVALLFLPDGSLLMAEDGNDTIWRVTYGK